LIAGVSSTVIIATISIMLLVTFFLAIYGAFLLPTSIITAQQMPIQQESLQTPTEELVSQQQRNQWEYLTVTFNGTFEGPFGSPSDYAGGIKDEAEDLGDTVSVIENGVPAVVERLNLLGEQGWELVSFAYNAGEQESVLIFKRIVE
jgi:hypothetical protein